MVLGFSANGCGLLLHFWSLVGKHDGMGVVLSPWVRQYTAGRFGLSTTYTGFKSLSKLFRNTEFFRSTKPAMTLLLQCRVTVVEW